MRDDILDDFVAVAMQWHAEGYYGDEVGLKEEFKKIISGPFGSTFILSHDLVWIKNTWAPTRDGIAFDERVKERLAAAVEEIQHEK